MTVLASMPRMHLMAPIKRAALFFSPLAIILASPSPQRHFQELGLAPHEGE